MYMGRCMAAKGLTDMAIEQFDLALQEGQQRMDSERKDCLYGLAVIYADSGKHEEALKYLKEIYAVDVNYRDVSARIEAFYRQSKQG